VQVAVREVARLVEYERDVLVVVDVVLAGGRARAGPVGVDFTGRRFRD